MAAQALLRAASVVLLCWRAATAGTCFSDDFSSIDSNWVSVDGDWSWSGGTVDNNVGNSGEGNVLYRDADYADGYLEASVSLSDGAQTGLLFRITDMPSAADYLNNGGQMYYCGIHTNSWVFCGRMNNAWLGHLFAYYTTITHGQFYDLGINMDGSDFTVFLDGAEIGSFSDSSYSSGGVGLRARYVHCIYDSISFKAPGCTTTTTTTGTDYILQAGRCYPQSEAPVINTASLMSDTLRRTGTPQECYDYCTGNSGFNIMGLDLRPTGGQDCMCKVAEDDYNGGADCKRRAGTSTAIEDMDWSSMTEDYVCFTETFDADAELSKLCDDVVSDAASSSSSNDKDSDNEGHLLMILIILPTLLLAVIAWAILVVIKRRKLASICDRLRRPSAAAPPAHEPTPLSPSTLASIEASNLKMMGMRSEEPVAEAITIPQGHITGAEAAAAMAAGEPPPQPSAGWGRRFASWRAVAEPPPPPEAEFEPEC